MKRTPYIYAYPYSGKDVLEFNRDEAKTSSLTLTQRFARFVILLLVKLSKGGDIMMAMFFAQRVILGKTTFDQVPKALKKGVAEVLIDSGLPELVPSEYGGSADLPAA